MAKFNYDISKDDLNLPPDESYLNAGELVRYMKVGNFIKKHWGLLKLKLTDEEILLSKELRLEAAKRTGGKRPVEIDETKLQLSDYAYWFRPAGCFINVIIPTYLLNGRQSNVNDRFQIISTSYHAAIYDSQDQIIYDPTIDTLEYLGAGYIGDEKKIGTLALLMTDEGICQIKGQYNIGTLSLAEYLSGLHCTKRGMTYIEIFNKTLGREVLKYTKNG